MVEWGVKKTTSAADPRQRETSVTSDFSNPPWKQIPLRTQLRIPSARKRKALFVSPQNTKRRRSRSGNIIESKLTLPHLVKITRYPARTSQIANLKATAQWRRLLITITMGMKEVPASNP
jgi:hypothetical protein